MVDAAPKARRSPLTPGQQKLAQKYMPLAKSLALPLKKAWPQEADEFESAALLALVQAAQSFEPTRGVKFATFARYRIWGALRDAQRGLILHGWRCDLDRVPSVFGLTYNTEELGRVLGSEPAPPVGEWADAVDFVESELRKLPARHAEACRQIYIHSKSKGEAAAAIGCSKSRLSYMHQEAIDIIRDDLAHRKESPC